MLWDTLSINKEVGIMEFCDDDISVQSTDPWQYVYFEKGEATVTLDGDFTLDELKELVAKVEYYENP